MIYALILARCTNNSPQLGIVKTQWYIQFIKGAGLRASTDKTARELDVIHKFMASVREFNEFLYINYN